MNSILRFLNENSGTEADLLDYIDQDLSKNDKSVFGVIKGTGDTGGVCQFVRKY